MNVTNLSVQAYARIPGTNASGVNYFSYSNYVSSTPCVLVTSVINGYPVVSAYYLAPTANYEMGLNYLNNSGAVQLLTYTGSQTGFGMTNIVNVSTNDTSTLLIDSSRPNG